MSAAVQPTPAQRSAEPSMEEILASIRRIIAEDQKALEAKTEAPVLSTSAGAVPAMDDGADDEDTLDLASIAPPLPASQPVAVPAPPAPADLFPALRSIVPPVLEPASPAQEPAVASVSVQSAPVVAASVAMAEVEQPLISPATEYAASAAFQSLTNTVFAQQSKTMDELVSDMLRPMLTAWLDEHLPTLVERLVKAEIERVARGGR